MNTRFQRLLGLVLLLTFAGCGGSQETAAKRPPTLGAVLPMFSHPFFVAQQTGLEDAAKAHKIAIDVRDGQDDDQKQIVQVEALVNLKCAAIILCPRDESALAPAVESANRANIPVITMNRRVQGGKVVAYVGADDADGGRAQGEELARALGPKGGKIIYLQGTPGSSPQVSREKGLKEVLARHPEIEIASDQFTNFQEDKAKAVMTGLVRRFKSGEIRAIVAQADELALPAAEVARGEGWKDLIVIGFNGTTDAFAAIRNGQMHATILQDAADQARKAVDLAVDHLAGKTVPVEIITPLPVVTKANIDQYQPSY
jgi:ribose transport system substrate-binding protein